jgi:gamma-glutamyl-gamma-aminobutyrate hydrolase PuuD
MIVDLDKVIEWLHEEALTGKYDLDPLAYGNEYTRNLADLEKDLRDHFKGQEFKNACQGKMQGYHTYR